MDTPNFQNIPLELQLYIFGLLTPFDLLTFRQVSKYYNDLSRQRSVWIEATSRVHKESSAFMPSFEFDKMSLLDLEYCAITPYRWLRLTDSEGEVQADSSTASDHEDTNTSPRSLCAESMRKLLRPEHLTFPGDVQIDSSDLGRFRNVYLVPGGRYLLTLSWNWTALWDLGVGATLKECDYFDEAFQPVAIVAAKYEKMALVHPTSDGLGLRILLRHSAHKNGDLSRGEDFSRDEDEDEDGDDADEDEDDGGGGGGEGGRGNQMQQNAQKVIETKIFEVYEIYPQSEDPEFSKIGSLAVSNGHQSIRKSIFSMSADRLVFIQEGVLKLWEFTTGEWTVIAIDPDFVQRIQQIIVSDTSIVLVGNSGVIIYPIPTQLFASQPPFTAILHTPPAFVLPYAWRNGRALISGSCHRPCNWYNGSRQRLLFEFVDVAEEVQEQGGVVGTTADGASTVLQAHAQPTGSLRCLEAIIAPDFLTAQVVEIKVLPANDVEYRFYNASRFCAGAIVETYSISGDDELVVQTFSCRTPDVDYLTTSGIDQAGTNLGHLGINNANASRNGMHYDARLPGPRNKAFHLLTVIDDADLLFTSFCPLSARLAYVDTKPDRMGVARGYIVIMDYFKRPEQVEDWRPPKEPIRQIAKGTKLKIAMYPRNWDSDPDSSEFEDWWEDQKWKRLQALDFPPLCYT